MASVYLSLGSNLGDRAQNIARALLALRARGLLVVRQSSLYETEPVNVRGGDWFLNCVMETETKLTPQQLMQTLLIIERSLGRRRSRVSEGPKDPRTIDIDILFFGAEVVETPELKIPHPRIAERRFVLAPLAELAPALLHPVMKKTVGELLTETNDHAEVRPFIPA